MANHNITIQVDAFTEEQRLKKARFLELIGTLDSSTLEILAKKIGQKGSKHYDEKIKKMKSLF